ncbi:Fc.00g033400.m01.CDS01 [Cosmosporella sp. VM-42]
MLPKGSVEMIQLLLAAGSDVNETASCIKFGRTPLQHAVDIGDLDIIDILLKAGADVNASPTRD